MSPRQPPRRRTLAVIEKVTQWLVADKSPRAHTTWRIGSTSVGYGRP